MADQPDGISIDVLKDLASTSDLKSFISSQGNAVFVLGKELLAFKGQPVSKAAGSFSASISLTGSPSWKAGPVTFSVTPTAKCTVTIATQGEDFEAAKDISDTTKTDNVQIPAVRGMTYVNIDLDFSISGNVAGSGTAYGITISGKAAGSTDTTLSFCQPVASTTETVQAILDAFNDIVLPTSPNASFARMIVGSSTRMTFDGTLSLELDVDYGLGDFKLAASSIALIQKAYQEASKAITFPTADVKAGLSATIKYTHTDHFGLILTKSDTNNAQLYLVRASTDETDVNVGITVAVTTTAVSVNADTSQIEQAVQSVTKSPALGTTVANAIAPKVADLESNALSKLNNEIKKLNGSAGLTLALSRQKGRTLLFNYAVDLSRPTIISQSWNDLLSNNVQDATQIPGFTVQPGSGITQEFKKSTTFSFQFFNLFKYSDETDFFGQCTSEITTDGIRILYEVGVEQLVAENSAKGQVRIYFNGAASKAADGTLSGASVDLNIEMSESSSAKSAALLVGILGIVDASALQATMNLMTAYAHANPKSTLGLTAVLHSSAYGRLKFSPFAGGIGGTPKVDQTADMANWNAIHAAAVTLLGKDNQFIIPYSYSDLTVYNSYCNTTEAGALLNRRHPGNPATVPSWFYQGAAPGSVDYFLIATEKGLNLFEDLATLAQDVQGAIKPEQFSLIINDTTAIVKDDINVDYAKPIMAAVIQQAYGAGTVDASTAQTSSSFTTTLKIS
jgi:hypothetical protein